MHTKTFGVFIFLTIILFPIVIINCTEVVLSLPENGFRKRVNHTLTSHRDRHKPSPPEWHVRNDPQHAKHPQQSYSKDEKKPPFSMHRGHTDVYVNRRFENSHINNIFVTTTRPFLHDRKTSNTHSDEKENIRIGSQVIDFWQRQNDKSSQHYKCQYNSKNGEHQHKLSAGTTKISSANNKNSDFPSNSPQYVSFNKRRRENTHKDNIDIILRKNNKSDFKDKVIAKNTSELLLKDHHEFENLDNHNKHEKNDKIKIDVDGDGGNIEDESSFLTRHFQEKKDVSEKFAIGDDYTFDYLNDEPMNDSDSMKPGVLTEQKWRNYGTIEAVENSRKRYRAEAQIVSDHITRIHLEAMCKIPRPKIVPITDVSKRYIPHCTVLHRCSDDTGCCHSDLQTCAPKTTLNVELYFYVLPFGSKEPVVETLSFVNHTECHCINKHPNNSHSDIKDSNDKNSTNSSCKCTSNFEVFEHVSEDDDYSEIINQNKDNQLTSLACRCDCASENQNCFRLKKGLEGFSLNDRRCISEGRCTTPKCQYGDYNLLYGRCPKSPQAKRMISDYEYNLHHH